MPHHRHQTASTALAAIRRHVHQWVGLVLYNSIYQNILLLHIYRILKFIYGFFSRSTELSRICGASTSSSSPSSPSTPLDCLWTPLGHPSSALVNNIHAGTIVYSNPSSNPPIPTGNGRRASVQTGPAAAIAPSSSSSAPIDPSFLASALASASSTLTARLSIESAESTDSSVSSIQSGPLVAEAIGEDPSEIHKQKLQQEILQRKRRHDSTVSSIQSGPLVAEALGEDPSGIHKQKQQQEVLQRKRRHDSTSSSSHTAIMDLRQSKAAAGMIYRIEAADCDPIEITRQILRKKRFPDSASLLTPAARKLRYALERVASTHQLAREINQRVHTKYDSTNPAHERKLMLLWDLLRPHDKLEGRYTKQWTEIGFQGKDPATDFRGMGMLGLDDLVYYAKYYPISSKNALECSHDAISWYSFAIVGINITSFAVQTLRTRQLQYYLFLNGTDRSVHHELYCYLFHRFNAFWSTLEPKPIIMDFERVFADFKIMMERQLARRKLMMLRYDTKENMLSGHGHHQPPSAVAAPPRLPQDEAGELIELETKKSK
ncbi:hypothetical protein EC957_003670 [Mortierella hygrophila]|uniref:ELMO domain-containing protein n=1 Tax=Mortierella hygrophila TaxID=979708 RepID=A0A9P6F1P5_9FUNG|nr:hypothetical protein EC957_003670 [Mortierella hygrophila]